MRGRTLNDSFIILDEAQNTTPEQMKTDVSECASGFNSKMVITGDLTQRDLPGSRLSLPTPSAFLGTSTTCRFAAFPEKTLCATPSLPQSLPPTTELTLKARKEIFMNTK